MQQAACGDARARFLCSVLVAAALGAFLVGAPVRLCRSGTLDAWTSQGKILNTPFRIRLAPPAK